VRRSRICQFRGCGNQAMLACELGGRRYYLCGRHYRLVLKWLRRLCEEHGCASLSWLGVKTRGGRITQIYVDEERARGN